MSTNLTSNIQWTDFTLNFWEGCDKVDDECKFCYMFRDFMKFGKDPRTIREVSDSTINKKIKAARALSAQRRYEGNDNPVIIFVSSWTDAFLIRADHLRFRMWNVIRDNPDLVFLLLTKRPELVPDRLPTDWGTGWDNVWIGTSVGQQKSTRRIIDLLKIPAKVRFLSCEPLIGPLRLDAIIREEGDGAYVDNCLTGFRATRAGGYSCENRKINWVIIGGESGNENGQYRYRESRIDWIVDLIRQCNKAGTPVFIKQLGTHLAKRLKLKDRHGGTIEEWPEYLRIRDFPNAEDTVQARRGWI
jgi:protein gp37